MGRENRATTPVISTVLLVAIVVILTVTLSVFVSGVTEDINDPAPNIADTTGDFDVGASGYQSDQIVRIAHLAGDSVTIGELEIIVRVRGPDSTLPSEARLVNLPAEGSSIDDKNIDGENMLIDRGPNPLGGAGPPHLLITSQNANAWSAGKTIQFRIPTGGADFREGEDIPSSGLNEPDADELEVVIVHTPSNSILSEHTFTP